MSNTTQAPRPVVVDLTREREYWAEAPHVLAILADLRATRHERDAALTALPDARVMNSISAVLEVDGKSYTADILRRWANAIDDAYTAPAPVPVADVPAFLAHRVQ